MDKIIKIKEKVQIGNVILEKGDKIELIKESIPIDIGMSIMSLDNKFRLDFVGETIELIQNERVIAEFEVDSAFDNY